MKLLFLTDDLENVDLVQPLKLVTNQLQIELDCLPLTKVLLASKRFVGYDALFVDCNTDSVHSALNQSKIAAIKKSRSKRFHCCDARRVSLK